MYTPSHLTKISFNSACTVHQSCNHKPGLDIHSHTAVDTSCKHMEPTKPGMIIEPLMTHPTTGMQHRSHGYSEVHVIVTSFTTLPTGSNEEAMTCINCSAQLCKHSNAQPKTRHHKLQVTAAMRLIRCTPCHT